MLPTNRYLKILEIRSINAIIKTYYWQPEQLCRSTYGTNSSKTWFSGLVGR